MSLKSIKEQRDEIVQRWKDSGLLDGLSGTSKTIIADLMCCKATQFLTDNDDKIEKAP